MLGLDDATLPLLSLPNDLLNDYPVPVVGSDLLAHTDWPWGVECVLRVPDVRCVVVGHWPRSLERATRPPARRWAISVGVFMFARCLPHGP